MTKFLVLGLLGLAAVGVSACSVFGHSGVESAPYDVVRADENIEVRTYERMILAVTPMVKGSNGRGGSFGRLFNYISGDNVAATKIPMTAPVFMAENESVEIPMTAPVFMGGEGTTMSFVLPAEYTMETAPVPTNDQVRLEEITDYTVAVIQFSGLLNDENSAKHEAQLREWIAGQPYEIVGEAVTAGYDAPFTIPAMRRNEILIPVKASE